MEYWYIVKDFKGWTHVHDDEKLYSFSEALASAEAMYPDAKEIILRVHE